MNTFAGDNIIVGSDALSTLNFFLQDQISPSTKIILLTDQTVRKHCLERLILSNSRIREARIYEIPEGEENKTFQQAYGLCKRFLQDGMERDTLLINLGGGMVCDLGGFVASIYKRGIRFIHVPTSLLAQVDAAIGGKTAVNIEGYKNQIGTFSNPAGVFVDPHFLHTLDDRQTRSGFAEIIKIALISDRDLWDRILRHSFSDLKTHPYDDPVWMQLIQGAILRKLSIVRQDPLDQQLRKTLNFGHTIGHALETYSLLHDPDPLLHGEAVAAGMICETYLAWKSQYISLSERDEIIGYLSETFAAYPITRDSFEELLTIMRTDKKNKGGEIIFVVPGGIGNVCLDITFGNEMIVESFSCYSNYRNDKTDPDTGSGRQGGCVH